MAQKRKTSLKPKLHLKELVLISPITENFVSEKVLEWTKEIEVLSAFAVSQPHASCACYTHGLFSKWTFLCRAIPNIIKLFHPLEYAIRYKLLPALNGQSALSDVECDLLAYHLARWPWYYKPCYFKWPSISHLSASLTSLILPHTQEIAN